MIPDHILEQDIAAWSRKVAILTKRISDARNTLAQRQASRLVTVAEPEFIKKNAIVEK